nr:5'-methylthioadenosine/adenosylhomocysteine nucleosidase [Campylobacter sp.]
MKIAILGAMQEEITPILSNLNDYQTIQYAQNEFYFAKFKEHELVIAYSKIGKVNSALTAALMIEKFMCDVVLFTGVAGSLNPDLHIGDILYATSTAQHDLDITAFGHPHGFVPGINVFENTDDKLNQIANLVANKRNIQIKSGIIVSGDQFICDNDKKSWIKNTFNADAVEMEGASVAQVCAMLGVPFFMLRVISDEANGGAEMDFNQFLEKSSEISANFLLGMIQEL